MSKYEEWLTEDGLNSIESMARDGLTDKQIATNIGVSEKTFTNWKKKYTSIVTALKKGKRPVDFEIENLLLKKARGYDYEEVETFIEEYNGKKKTKIRKIKKHHPPDTSAIIFWLKNRKPEVWRKMSPEFKQKVEMETFKIEQEAKLLQFEVEKLEQSGEVNDLLKALYEIRSEPDEVE